MLKSLALIAVLCSPALAEDRTTKLGFTLTVATLWLVPLIRQGAGWGWAFAALAPGPVLGVLAMRALSQRPEAARLAAGRG